MKWLSLHYLETSELSELSCLKSACVLLYGAGCEFVGKLSSKLRYAYLSVLVFHNMRFPVHNPLNFYEKNAAVAT
jgi:hypothetical protein